MSEYLRIVSYISEYIDGAKGKSCGFARIESPGNGGKIYVNIHTNKQFVDGNVIVAMYKEANGIKPLCASQKEIENYKAFIISLKNFFVFVNPK